MPFFRVNKTKDYTIMANHHLKNRELSLKAKGLLSVMLSLPEDWHFTVHGLVSICKEGRDSISGAVRELEEAGYIVRHRLRDKEGHITSKSFTMSLRSMRLHGCCGILTRSWYWTGQMPAMKHGRGLRGNLPFEKSLSSLKVRSTSETTGA